MQIAGESTQCHDVPARPNCSSGKNASSSSAKAARRSNSSVGPSAAVGAHFIIGNASSNPTVSQSRPAPTLSCRRLSCPSSCEVIARSSSFCHTIGAARPFGSTKLGGAVASFELGRFLPDIWLRSNPSHRWERGEVRLKERESFGRRKRQKRLNLLKRR